MLNPVRAWHHVVVALLALVPAALVALGVIGAPSPPEHFESKQVVVIPDGRDGVRITEVVDLDFGAEDRHGYERAIPHDFGVPVEIVASSDDAPDNLDVEVGRDSTRIRIGDPNTTITGQHRYVLSYTLPDAQLSSGVLALDVIDYERLDVDRYEVVVAGMDLEDTFCSAGSFGAVGGCTLERDGDVYRAVIDDLKKGEGITIRGTVVGTSTPVGVAEPPLPARRTTSGWLAVACAVLGLVTVVVTFLIAKRQGRNEVAAGGAADAAFAGSSPVDALVGAPTRLVTDAQLGELATVEFAPPAGVEPWQGTVLLSETIGQQSVSAWFAGLIGRQVLELDADEYPRTLRLGTAAGTADPDTVTRLTTALGSDGEMELGTYQPTLKALWDDEASAQRSQIAASGWWRAAPPGTSAKFARYLLLPILLAVALAIVGLWIGWWHTPWMAVVISVAFPAVVAATLYRPLLPSRSAAGSAMALRVESFRRFLERSEGQHVDWAWKQGVLREYTAWAVALGAAEAWGRALQHSTVPPPEVASLTTPLSLSLHSSLWSASTRAPQSSGGSGGGFSSGLSGGFSVGGGGGGGSSGSW